MPSRKKVESGDPGGQYGHVEGCDDGDPAQTGLGHLVGTAVSGHIENGPAQGIAQDRPGHQERDQ